MRKGLTMIGAGVAFAVFVWVLSAAPWASGFAAGAFKAVLAVALFAAFDRWVLPGDACEEVIERGNVAYAVMLVALAVLVGATVATAQGEEKQGETGIGKRESQRGWVASAISEPRLPISRPPHVDTALSYVGTVEATGRNDGARVERFLASVGLRRGAPWCAAFVSYCLRAVGAAGPVGRDGRAVRSGLAARFLVPGRIEARVVLRGAVAVPPGSVAVWRRGETWQGHAGFVVDWPPGACGRTVEGNTSIGASGSQRDGDGVWARRRCISPAAFFRVVAFAPVGPATAKR